MFCHVCRVYLLCLFLHVCRVFAEFVFVRCAECLWCTFPFTCAECPWNPDEAEQLACPGVDSLLGTECSIDCGKVVCAGKSDDEVKAMCATMRREFYARFGLSPDERSDENSDENSNENSDGDDS